MAALNTGIAFLVISSFLASAVEMVEALTIVLAVGVSRQWRSTLVGVATALCALAGLVLVLGPALVDRQGRTAGLSRPGGGLPSIAANSAKQG